MCNATQSIDPHTQRMSLCDHQNLISYASRPGGGDTHCLYKNAVYMVYMSVA
jgi:hypothetical protein